MRQPSVLNEIDERVSEMEIGVGSTTSESTIAQSPVALSLTDVLWIRRRLFLRATLSALAIGTICALLIPPKYDSTVSILPPDSPGESGMMIAALAGKTSPEIASLAGSLVGAKTSGAVVTVLLGSRTVQDRIIERFQLQKVYWKRYKEDARRVLNGRTSIVEDRKSGVITVTVRDRNPERARDIAQAYIEELNHLMSEVSTSSARRQRIFIEQRLAAVKADLSDAEKQFSEFASKNTVLDVKEQTKAMVESAAIVQGQLIAAQSELQALEQIYSQNNVRVRATHARVEELKAELQKLGGSDSSLLSDVTQDGQLYPSIRKLPLLGVRWADLYRRMKTQETVYELLTQQYEMARIQEAKEIPSVSVIDPAEVPESKAFPPRILLITGLTLLSLFIVLAWVVGAWRVHQLEAADPRRILFVRVSEQASMIMDHARDMPFFSRMRANRWGSQQNGSKPLASREDT